MNPLSKIQKQQKIITAFLLLLILACGPTDRLQELNRPEQILVATGSVIIDKNNNLAAEAYEKIQTLPGYRLESQSIKPDRAGNLTHQVIISQYDARGNIHTLTQTAAGRQNEVYLVDGHTYVFEAQYEGWVDISPIISPEGKQAEENLLANPGPEEKVVQLLTQFAAIPTKSGHETLKNRPASRYKLQYIMSEIAVVFGRAPTDSAITLRGTLWIDDATGTLLKSEFLLYEDEVGQPTQEYRLEISEIGNIAPLAIPSPVVDPTAIAAATATAQAQAWTVLNAVFDYQSQQINFELVPVRATQIPNSSPLSVEMQLFLRQLPERVFGETEPEPFLIQLQKQLSLSIPKRNLIVASSDFRLESTDSQKRSLNVLYFFNADLEDFDHVELILSQPGNPLFAPVPVE